MRHLRILLVTLVLACTFGALAFGQRRSLGRPTSTLVWQGEKVDVGGSVSPDGRYISFTDWVTGDLSLHDLVTSTNRTIVAANNGSGGRVRVFAEASTISHDARQVAYSWYDESKDRYELWLANLRGDAPPRRLYAAENVEWLAPRDWSPDGRWIAALLSSNDFTHQIALISVNDGDLRILKAGHWSANTRLFFSPDGQYLAYDLPQGSVGARDVWVSAVNGAKDNRAVAHRANDIAMGWSPDGKYLLFTSDRTGSVALFGLEIQAGTPRGAPAPLKPDMGLAESIGVTSAGALFWGTQPGRRGGSILVALRADALIADVVDGRTKALLLEPDQRRRRACLRRSRYGLRRRQGARPATIPRRTVAVARRTFLCYGDRRSGHERARRSACAGGWSGAA